MLDVTIPAAALGGLISFLSPCVLPLVPPYLSFLAGVTLDELQAQDDWGVRRRAILTALLFVAGFSTVFVLLGATASVLGQAIRQYVDVLSTIAGLAIIAMGLHFLGLFRIGFLYREARLSVDKSVDVWGAYMMGLAFAFGWTPCIGPILAAILAVAGSETSVARGAILLAAYSAGLGAPFVLAALAMGPLSACSDACARASPTWRKRWGRCSCSPERRFSGAGSPAPHSGCWRRFRRWGGSAERRGRGPALRMCICRGGPCG